MSRAITLHVEVTADDIAKGKPHTVCRCPIARAIARALQTLGRPPVCFVFRRRVQVWRVSLALPWAAKQFIRRFDGGKVVEPIVFDLPLLDPLKEATCLG